MNILQQIIILLQSSAAVINFCSVFTYFSDLSKMHKKNPAQQPIYIQFQIS